MRKVYGASWSFSDYILADVVVDGADHIKFNYTPA